MKKATKIIVIILVCIVATMAIVPLAFRGKIKEIVISEAEQYLNAEFGFDDLSISLFNEFPQASVGIEGFWLRGKEVFANDTLAYIGKVEVAVNLMSIFGDGGYDITKISVEDTHLKAIVLEDGRANWDIMAWDTTEEPEDTASSSFRILLKKVSVENVNIIYDDRQSGIYAQIDHFGAGCSGDMAADEALLDLQATIEALTFKLEGVPLLNRATINADLNIDADFANSKFTLRENTLSLNAICATIDGWASLPTDAPMNMDLRLNTSDISFKEILSLIPAIYAKDFQDLRAEGTVSLHAYAKGELTDSIIPQFEAALNVNDGNFRYPALPAGIDDIQVNIRINNPGGDIDLTKINVERFSLNMLGNPFAVTALVETPVSDPNVAAAANGVLNLGKVKEIYPLEDMALNGIVKADIKLGGRLSYIEKEQYERFKADGTISIQDMQLHMEELPEISIEQSTFGFTPKYLNLSDTKVVIGENDLAANCRFENYLSFLLKGETLKGELNLKSHHMNLNDFMTQEESPQPADNKDTEEEDAETDAAGVLVIPKNIDFNMNVDMDEILFGTIALHNLNGTLAVKEGTADISNLTMHTMGGAAIMNGTYSTAQSESSPRLNASFALNELSFAQTFQELQLIQQMAPIFEKLNGNFSGKIRVDTELDSIMSPKLNTLTASGELRTRNLNLSGVDIIDRIAEATQREELKEINVKDLNLDFTIKDGRVTTAPFAINMGNTSLSLSGSTGLDQTIDYKGKLTLPSNSTSSINSIGLKIGGKFNSPKITIDTQSIVRQATSTVADKVIESVGNKLGIDISNAEKQKEELVKSAQQVARKLVSEAETQKANLISKAGSNPLKKLAAEKAGDLLITEAKAQGEKLIAEAEQKGNELIERAMSSEP